MSSPKNKKISQKDEINIEENEFNIKIFKRTSENYTHEVIEDTKIKRITSWRKSRKKFLQSKNRYNRNYVGPDDDYWYEKKK